jgi:hypothetical protein
MSIVAVIGDRKRFAIHDGHQRWHATSSQNHVFNPLQQSMNARRPQPAREYRL